MNSIAFFNILALKEIGAYIHYLKAVFGKKRKHQIVFKAMLSLLLSLSRIASVFVLDEEIKEEVGAVVVNNETASQVADETVIMTPVREKKRPIKNRPAMRAYLKD